MEGLLAAVCHIGLLSVDGLLAAGSFGLWIAEGLPAAGLFGLLIVGGLIAAVWLLVARTVYCWRFACRCLFELFIVGGLLAAGCSHARVLCPALRCHDTSFQARNQAAQRGDCTMAFARNVAKRRKLTRS